MQLKYHKHRMCAKFYATCLAAVIALDVVTTLTTAESNYSVCETDICKAIAEDLNKTINTLRDPCKDIYSYVCDGWINNHDIPSGSHEIGIFSIMEDTTNARIREILEAAASDKDGPEIRKAKAIYSMCMNEEERNLNGLITLHKIISRVSEWPLTIPCDGWKVNISWQAIAMDFDRNFFESAFYDISVVGDVDNVTVNALYLRQPSFFLPAALLVEPMTSPELVDAYTKFVKEVVVASHWFSHLEHYQKAIDEDVNNLIQFERQLAFITGSLSTERSPLYTRMTIEELQKMYDGEGVQDDKAKIDWLDIIRNRFFKTSITITSLDEIIVVGPSYFSKLAPLLQKTPLRTIANYVQWTAIRDMLKFTDDTMSNILFAVEKETLGVKEKKERWIKCIEAPNLVKAVSYEYIKKYFPKETKEEVLHILNEIKTTVQNEISSASWMDQKTKVAATEKLNAMVSRIGYPDWYSDGNITKYYDNFQMESTYLECVVNLRKHEGNNQLKTLRYPTDQQMWTLEPTKASAVIDFSTNAIVMTAAVLQDAIIDRNRPKVMNYGSLGFLLARQVFRAFDIVGSKFDKYGHIYAWWTNETTTNYVKKTQCFIKQYGEYVWPNPVESDDPIHLNSVSTLISNIADSVAIQIVWKTWLAYKNTVDPKTADVRLLGLEEYSSDKLLFISVARASCEKLKPEAAKHMLESIVPQQLRILGSFSNLHAFSETFGCTETEERETCTIWS